MEMDETAIASIGVAVTLLTQLIKFAGLPDTRGPLVVLLLAAMGVGLWAFSNDPGYTRGDLWQYFVAWLTVAATAAGIFGFTRALPSAVTATKQPPPGAAQEPTEKIDPVGK